MDFCCNLALRLGMPLHKVLDLPISELRIWCAKFQLDPYTDTTWSTAQLCATMYNCVPGRKKPVQASDLLPKTGRKRQAKVMSAKQITAAMRIAVARTANKASN